MTPLQVFIGYDSKEPIAYHVLAHSILSRASCPVSITPLALNQLSGIYKRPRGPTESTEFSLSRFLVPYLCGFKGRAIFMDCDMLCLSDIAELVDDVEKRNPLAAVSVCQHDYAPKAGKKFLGQQQTAYPRKNWSSLMVFHNALCWRLTPAYVNEASGLDLHRFTWLDDSRIGKLPLGWNWLVGEYPKNNAACILHYTLGGPWFPETRNCDHAREWFAEERAMGVQR